MDSKLKLQVELQVDLQVGLQVGLPDTVDSKLKAQSKVTKTKANTEKWKHVLA